MWLCGPPALSQHWDLFYCSWWFVCRLNFYMGRMWYWLLVHLECWRLYLEQFVSQDRLFWYRGPISPYMDVWPVHWTSNWIATNCWEGGKGREGGGGEGERDFERQLISYTAREKLGSRFGGPGEADWWEHSCHHCQQPQQPLWISLLSSAPARHLGCGREKESAHYCRWSLRWNGMHTEIKFSVLPVFLPHFSYLAYLNVIIAKFFSILHLFVYKYPSKRVWWSFSFPLHWLQVFKGHEHHPLGHLSEGVPVISCGALSKRYLVPGLRCGWLVIYDKQGVLKDSVS